MSDNFYRAVQRAVVSHTSTEGWKDHQKEASECAVEEVFKKLLPGAEVYRDNYYPANQSLKNLKGEIDVKRHLRFNIPANGKIAYRTRELSYDNSVTQLIRHTIEYLKRTSYGRYLLKNNAITKDAVKRIVDATFTYDSRERSTVIRENIRPVIHPYYDRYTAPRRP